mmetsp:Transcript_11286/g.51201  ORF Transcript_11286/g.51201 Transcript_11286/m.51201 type:complete len:362 (+) Transcript_11286:1953-3038(+)
MAGDLDHLSHELLVVLVVPAAAPVPQRVDRRRLSLRRGDDLLLPGATRGDPLMDNLDRRLLHVVVTARVRVPQRRRHLCQHLRARLQLPRRVQAQLDVGVHLDHGRPRPRLLSLAQPERVHLGLEPNRQLHQVVRIRRRGLTLGSLVLRHLAGDVAVENLGFGAELRDEHGDGARVLGGERIRRGFRRRLLAILVATLFLVRVELGDGGVARGFRRLGRLLRSLERLVLAHSLKPAPGARAVEAPPLGHRSPLGFGHGHVEVLDEHLLVRAEVTRGTDEHGVTDHHLARVGRTAVVEEGRQRVNPDGIRVANRRRLHHVSRAPREDFLRRELGKRLVALAQVLTERRHVRRRGFVVGVAGR